jgi:hypothetical protein
MAYILPVIGHFRSYRPKLTGFERSWQHPVRRRSALARPIFSNEFSVLSL